MVSNDSKPPANAQANDQHDKPDNALVATAITGAVVVAALFVLFRLAASASYRAEAQTSFLLTCVAITGVLIAATAAPRLVGHGLAAVLSLAAIVGGISGRAGLPLLLVLVLLTVGVGSLLMTWKSYVQRSRPAWAFLCSTLAIMGVCTLFGAPKVRNLVGVNMWVALMIPGLLAAAVTGLGMVATEYRERAIARR